MVTRSYSNSQNSNNTFVEKHAINWQKMIETTVKSVITDFNQSISIEQRDFLIKSLIKDGYVYATSLNVNDPLVYSKEVEVLKTLESELKKQGFNQCTLIQESEDSFVLIIDKAKYDYSMEQARVNELKTSDTNPNLNETSPDLEQKENSSNSKTTTSKETQKETTDPQSKENEPTYDEQKPIKEQKPKQEDKKTEQAPNQEQKTSNKKTQEINLEFTRLILRQKDMAKNARQIVDQLIEKGAISQGSLADGSVLNISVPLEDKSLYDLNNDLASDLVLAIYAELSRRAISFDRSQIKYEIVDIHNNADAQNHFIDLYSARAVDFSLSDWKKEIQQFSSRLSKAQKEDLQNCQNHQDVVNWLKHNFSSLNFKSNKRAGTIAEDVFVQMRSVQLGNSSIDSEQKIAQPASKSVSSEQKEKISEKTSAPTTSNQTSQKTDAQYLSEIAVSISNYFIVRMTQASIFDEGLLSTINPEFTNAFKSLFEKGIFELSRDFISKLNEDQKTLITGYLSNMVSNINSDSKLVSDIDSIGDEQVGIRITATNLKTLQSLLIQDAKDREEYGKAVSKFYSTVFEPALNNAKQRLSSEEIASLSADFIQGVSNAVSDFYNSGSIAFTTPQNETEKKYLTLFVEELKKINTSVKYIDFPTEVQPPNSTNKFSLIGFYEDSDRGRQFNELILSYLAQSDTSGAQ